MGHRLSRRRSLATLALSGLGLGLEACASGSSQASPTTVPAAAPAKPPTSTIIAAPTPTATLVAEPRVAAMLTPSSPPTSPVVATPSPAVQPTIDAAEGLQVGQRLPAFAVTGVDGAPITNPNRLSTPKPYILFFFATW